MVIISGRRTPKERFDNEDIVNQLEVKIQKESRTTRSKTELFKESAWQNNSRIRGMNDCAPTESPLWQWIEAQVMRTY